MLAIRAFAVLLMLGVPGAWAATPIAASWKSALQPLSAGGWAFISDGPPENPSAVYASTHDVLHDGNVVTAWMRWEFSRPQAEVYPLHYLSAVTREQLDCDARTYRRSAVFYYLRNNLQQKGPAFTELNDDTTWKAAIPGSEADAMLSWGCTPTAGHPPRSAATGDAASAAAKSARSRPAARSLPADKAGLPPATRATALAPQSAAQSAAPAVATGGLNLNTAR